MSDRINSVGPARGVGLAALGVATVSTAFVFPMLDVWTRPTIANAALALIGLISLGSERSILRPNVPALFLGLVSGAALYAGAWVITRWPSAASQTHLFLGWTTPHSTTFLVATLPIAVLGEELFWRAAVRCALQQRVPLPIAVVASTVAYAFAHIASGTWLLPFAALGAGAVWAVLFVATRNLTASVVSHLVFDVLVVLIAPPA